MKKRWMVGIILMALILMVITYANIGLPWDYLKTKKEFNQHLLSYKVEMVVDEVNYDFLHGGYHGKAHPKNNPDLQFYVGQNERLNRIEDGYTYQRLRERANQEVKAILNNYLPDRILPDPEVEVVDFDARSLEISVITSKVVDEQTREDIKQAIIEKGFKPDQLYFEAKNGG